MLQKLIALCAAFLLAAPIAGDRSPLLREIRLKNTVHEMSLREKVSQLFIVRPESLSPGRQGLGATSLTDSMAAILSEYPAGGVIQFAANITDPVQITSFNRALSDALDVPPFIAVDEEGGSVSRLANEKNFDLPVYESAAAVGKSGRKDDALAMGRAIGGYLSEYGFDLDFAPVADVFTNPANTVIGRRAFSTDAAVVRDMTGAFADGLRENGIISCFKHFPGHGDTAEDSHVGLAVNAKTKEELMNCEWLPYKGLPDDVFVMIGHIALPAVVGDSTPATLSKQVVTDILRGELGFEGLIVTDSMEMGAIVNTYGANEAAVMAFEAGCDVILCPVDYLGAVHAIESAVADGRIPEERLDESVMRILKVKDFFP